MSTEPSRPSDDEVPATGPDASATDAGVAAEPGDTRARFRAALERKRARQNAAATGVPGDPKMHGTHGAVGGKRVFRRKSG